ncbi:S-layer-like y domain-containing protein [Paenibacillus sediminis]|uniref:SLH domain-containing protein n=1 Tax=Paenibacillus sediminis TaxID=664909 RepID=A0ABS4GZH3_9BACL|nr:S-layer homology domain-containing protein [Paenibacillus sediminis]MBP1935675.1 hypothetical protein [Paenibacillus sediminis]
MKKKWLSTLLSVAMMTIAIPSAFAAAPAQNNVAQYFPSDVKGHWAANVLNDYVYAGILKGYNENGKVSLKPDSSVTRAEFVAMLVRAAEPATSVTQATYGTTATDATYGTATGATYGTTATGATYGATATEATYGTTVTGATYGTTVTDATYRNTGTQLPIVNVFSDVKQGDWFYTAVVEAYSLGIVKGVDATHFNPNGKITRAEISAILSRFFEKTIKFTGTASHFNDITSNWAKDDIVKLSEAGIATGYKDGGFHPKATATRAEAISLLSRAFLKENSQTVADETLINFVKQALLEQDQAFKNGTSDEMKSKVEKNNVGFAKDIELFIIDFNSKQVAGNKVELNLPKELNGQVVSKSDRFAVVKIAGDDTYYLRKTQDGWKIYGSDNLYKGL